MSEMNQLKVYSVEEANQLIPRLRELILELQHKRDQILTLEVEIDALELVVTKNSDGESAAIKEKVDAYTNLVNGFYSGIDEIHEMGCLLKDVNMGLVDFYTMVQGRMVYLCWKMDEPEVAHWHEIGRGFAYRQPIVFDPDGQESSG